MRTPRRDATIPPSLTISERGASRGDSVTFFFCLPPPDLAGLEDGGGALSFFGACNGAREQIRDTSGVISCAQWRRGKGDNAPSRLRRRCGDGGREGSEGAVSAAPALGFCGVRRGGII